MTEVGDLPEIDLTDVEMLRDPATAYGRARERSPLARIVAPGLGPMWAVTRHEGARAMLTDPRFELNADSFMRPPGIPEHCLAYMRTMQEMEVAESTRGCAGWCRPRSPCSATPVSSPRCDPAGHASPDPGTWRLASLPVTF